MSFEKIFFSYSRHDASDFALKLATDLKKEGFKIWIDQQDIRAGSEWDIEIEKALETCDCLLFVESPKSVASTNVLNEVYYALEQNKRVIPVIINDSKTPFRLQRLQFIDFSSDYNAGLAKLIKQLQDTATPELADSTGEEEIKTTKKKGLSKPLMLTLIIASILIIAAAGIFSLTRNNKEPDSTSAGEENLNEIFVGEWKLADVEPKPLSQNGSLRIEAIDEKKVKIRSNFQFYYKKTNDTAFFSVFNGFADCASCVLEKEMKITDRDVAIGTHRYKILKQDQQGEGKAGDTILNAASNNSIRALVQLHLLDKDKVTIKVSLPAATPLSQGMVAEPFVYSFVFRKRTD